MFDKINDWINTNTQITAEKCRKTQGFSIEKKLKDKLNIKVSEINARIEFVVNSFDYESTVIYALDYFEDLYDQLNEHYSKLGFQFTKVEVKELNKIYVIISWN